LKEWLYWRSNASPRRLTGPLGKKGGERDWGQESFEKTVARMKASKAEVMKRQMDLLEEKYDLSNRPAPGVTMSRGKPVQEGLRAHSKGSDSL